MKTFEELTHEEILTLTDEDIQRYCDLACAQEGAPLLPPEPGEKPEKPAHEPDVEVFMASGEYFLSQESALAVAAAINQGNPIDWTYAAGYSQKRITGHKGRTEAISGERLFSPEMWDEVKGEMLAYNEAKKRWNEEKNEYDEAVKARSRVTEWIWDEISKTRETERQRERFANLLSRYIDLAEGDEATARKFLLQAHPEAEEFLPPVKGVEEG